MIDTLKPILVTGAAGFIGFQLSKKLLNEGYNVVGVDNINSYYDPRLKNARLEILKEFKDFAFYKIDLHNQKELIDVFDQHKFDYVVNLAAQAGVRYSLENPFAYIDSNVLGFLNVLERSRLNAIKHVVYASSSSVYGANGSMPFKTSDNVDHPLSLYAATKKSNELLAHSFAYSFNLPVTGLRFFSVYGPWGRPDMALFIFTKNIIEGKPIDVYNNGEMIRDFTYVEDIVNGILKIIPRHAQEDKNWNPKSPNPNTSFVPYKLYNIGNHSPINLMEFISCIEEELNKKAILNFLPMQLGDIPASFADVDDLISETGYSPNTSIKQGVRNFIKWYKEFYNIA